MTERKNFSGQSTPSIIDTEYHWCNFTQPAPIDVAGKKRGVRLFPGDDTPRSFHYCNLINAEPPPGSTLERCNTTIKTFDQVTTTDTITIDGQAERIDHHSDFAYGRYNPATDEYDDLPTPEEDVID